MSIKAIIKEFRDFAVKGNFIDICVGLLVGAGIVPVASSFIKDIVMPPIGLLLGGVDFSQLFFVIKQGSPLGPYASREAATAAGAVTINYGLFLNTLISFLLVMVVAFFAVRGINKLRPAKAEPPAKKSCPHCLSDIALKAKKCAFCTADLAG